MSTYFECMSTKGLNGCSTFMTRSMFKCQWFLIIEQQLIVLLKLHFSSI